MYQDNPSSAVPAIHQRHRSMEFGSFANFHLLLLIHTVNAYERNPLKYQQEAIWRSTCLIRSQAKGVVCFLAQRTPSIKALSSARLDRFDKFSLTKSSLRRKISRTSQSQLTPGFVHVTG